MSDRFGGSRRCVVTGSVVLLDQIATGSATAREIQWIRLLFRLQSLFFVHGVGIAIGPRVIARVSRLSLINLTF